MDDIDVRVTGGPLTRERLWAPAIYAEETGDGGATPGIVEYLGMIRTRLWLVLGVTCVFLAAAATYSVLARPVFEAQAQLLIEPDLPRVVPFDGVAAQETGKADYYQTQYQILRSRTLARRTLDTLQLWGHPEFRARRDTPGVFASTVQGFVARQTGRNVPDAPDATGASTAEMQAIGRFLNALTIEPVRNSRLLNVRYASPDPRLAAAVVNALVEGYIARTLEFSAESSRQAQQWLDERLTQQRIAVEASELQLQQSRARNDSLAADGGLGVVGQRLTDLNAALTRARAERIEQESAYAQLAAAASGATLVPPGVTSPTIEAARQDLATRTREVSRLAGELGERHPDLVAARDAARASEARLRAEVMHYVETARQGVAIARAKESGLEEAFAAQKARAVSLDRQAIAYGVQQREATSNRQMFEALLQRAQETAVSGALTTSNIRIVDRADVPLSSTYPRKRVVMGVAAFSGVSIGLALALLLGHIDDRLRTAVAIRRHLRLPCLGTLPRLGRRALRDGDLVFSRDTGTFREAMLGIRTQLTYDWTGDGARVVLVAGSMAGEGKSLVAANLAAALASPTVSVLLVDGDMRRPRLHTVFACDQSPGLSEVLSEAGETPGMLRETSVQGLTLLPAGAPVSSVAERLGFEPSVRLLETFGNRFRWIIVDSPPVSDATDACLFAHRGARVLFVVGAGRVRRPQAWAAVTQFATAGADFIGSVLNGAGTGRNTYGPA